MTGRRSESERAGEFERRLEREGDAFGRSPFLTFFKWMAIFLVVIGILVLMFGFTRFVLGWFGAGAEIVSPTNVKQQYALVIGDWEALQQEAANACAARSAPERENSPTFLEDPSFAYAAKYRETAADYNRRMNNLFEAKIVAPGGYPRRAPTLEEMQARVC